MITHSDTLRLLNFIAGLQGCTDRAQFGADLIRLMSAWIPSTIIAYDQIEEQTGFYEIAHNAPLDAANTVRYLSRLKDVYKQNPIYAYIQSGGPEHVVDISQLASHRQLRRTDFYHDIFKPFGIRHQINVFLPCAGWITSLTINHDRPFTPEQRELLRFAGRYILLAHRSVGIISELQSSCHRFPVPAQALSNREEEVFHWLGEGKRNAEIARLLGCSARTVEKHVENILRKTHTETRTAAANYLKRQP